jgi:hypothetical protein
MSVMTRRGVVPLEAMARWKKVRAATRSRLGDTYASVTNAAIGDIGEKLAAIGLAGTVYIE